MRPALAWVVFSFIFCRAPTVLAQESRFVTLERTEGDVQIQPNGVLNTDTPWAAANAGAQIGINDRVKTGEGEGNSAVLLFRDGSTIRLKSSSALGITELGSDKISVDLSFGEIEARISAGKKREFWVSSAHAAAVTQAEGSEFDFEVPSSGATFLEVLDGTVRFRSQLGGGFITKTGQRRQINPLGRMSVVPATPAPQPPPKPVQVLEKQDLHPEPGEPRPGFWDRFEDIRPPVLRLGIGQIFPYYRLTESYDSNIYLVPDDKPGGVTVGGGKRDSWITTNEGGLNSNWTLTPTDVLNVSGGANYRAYTTQPEANDSFGDRANASFLHRGGRFKAGLSDDYLNTTDPAFSELIARQQRWRNIAAGLLEYGIDGGRLFAGIDGSHETDKYVDASEGALLNHYDDLAGVKLGYQIQPQTRVYTAYHREIIHYTAGRSAGSKSDLLDLGVEGQISPEITGQAQAGLVYRRYDFDPMNPELGRDVNTWRTSVNLLYRPLERTRFLLSVSRSLAESTFLPNRYYISNLAVLTAEHRLPSNLTVGMNFGLGVDQYPQAATVNGVTANRKDYLYLEEIHLRYDIQHWLYVEASYQNRTRFSTFSDSFDYRDDLTSLSMGVKF